MKRIPLNQGKFALVDDDKYELVARFHWCAAYNKGRWYALCQVMLGRINGEKVYSSMYMHRLIMRPPKDKQIDHINHNCLDNRIENMRECTQSQNNANRKINTTGTSKYKGVCWLKNKYKWRACIKLEGKTTYLGNYDNEIDAAKAYDNKATEIFGEFAYTNFQKRA